MPPRPPLSRRGMSLVELLMALSIVGIVSAGAASLVSGVLKVDKEVTEQTQLEEEARTIFEQLRTRVQTTVTVMIPNAAATQRNFLALSGRINEDNDNYFGDPLFPRIDEDPSEDMNNDAANGIKNIDDDNDGVTDEILGTLFSLLNLRIDDDEDGTANDDPWNGVDDDGDGNIDEDVTADINGDGKSGWAGLDDNGDGIIDLKNAADDDEDGSIDEDPLNEVIISIVNGQLVENTPSLSRVRVLSTHVTDFHVIYERPDAQHDPSYRIFLTLQMSTGSSYTFDERCTPRNVTERFGRRVR